MKRLVLAPVLLLILAGCGEDTEDGTALAADRTPEPTTSVTVTATVGGQQTNWVLECGPPGGSHPRPEPACAILLSAGELLTAPPTDRACTQIYGGPEQARVVGTVQGKAVDRSFDRANGCAIAAWDAMGAVLPEPEGVAGP